MRIQYRGQALFLVVVFTARSKHTRNLRKDAHRVYRVDVRDNIAVRVFVFEQKRTEIRLATTHHLLDSCNNRRISNDNRLVETWEQRPSRDR